MVNTLLRTVGIVNLQTVALLNDIVAHCFQTIGSLLGKQCRRFLIAVNTATHEVISTEVTDFQDDIGHHVSDGYKLTAIVSRTHYGILLTILGASEYTYTTNDDDEKDGKCPQFLLFHILCYYFLVKGTKILLNDKEKGIKKGARRLPIR